MTAAATVVLAKALKRKIQLSPMAKTQAKSLYLCSQSFSRAAGTLAAFGIIIVLGTLIAYTVYLESTKYIPASETGALAAFEPLSAYAVSILFMGNRVGFVEMAGALCIMVMVWMLSKKA